MKVQLVVVQGKPEGMVIPLASSRYKIGRGEGCQLRPNSDLVSREHAEFSMGADSVSVQDLGSRNGTDVNGKKLTPNQPFTLKSGDLIKVGTLTFAISIEGVPTAKPILVGSGGSRKPSLDDVSGDEIDAWLVSDETRPTPERPSGVYGGDTITLATYNGQEKEKTKPTPAPAPRAVAPPAKPVLAPVAKAPEPVPVPAPVVVPVPAPVVVPVPEPTPVAKVAEPVLEPLPSPVMIEAPAPAPAPTLSSKPPVNQESMSNPLFDFLQDNLPENTGEEQEPERYEENVEDDGIEDLSALQEADQAGDDESNAMPEEFIDESNPFYVKKKGPEQSAASGKPIAGAQDSSSAAGDVLRKLLDRRRASKS